MMPLGNNGDWTAWLSEIIAVFIPDELRIIILSKF